MEKKSVKLLIKSVKSMFKYYLVYRVINVIILCVLSIITYPEIWDSFESNGGISVLYLRGKYHSDWPYIEDVLDYKHLSFPERILLGENEYYKKDEYTLKIFKMNVGFAIFPWTTIGDGFLTPVDFKPTSDKGMRYDGEYEGITYSIVIYGGVNAVTHTPEQNVIYLSDFGIINIILLCVCFLICIIKETTRKMRDFRI